MAVKSHPITTSPGPIFVQDEGILQGGDVDTFNFTGAGVVAAVVGNIATITIAGGGGGAVAFTAATIVVPYGLQFQIVNVVDAAIGVLSKIMVIWGMFIDTDENTADMDDIEFNAVALAGSMDVRVSARNPEGRVGGTYKIMYLVG